ncbi:MAG: tryptophan--tRNA ligase [Candidatus Vogelbacteria bacterium]|nr:tryptophan--tRNA ligase [Candidatus Vogelbacteria bacterium]
MDEKQVIVTGVRPTGDLHIANYLGAVMPLVKTLEANKEAEVFVFVADLHGLTDNDAQTISDYRLPVVKDYLALGLDKYLNSGKVHLFIQSQIGELISYLALFLSRYTTFNDLMRVPTLKEKLRVNQEAGQANALLGYYPVLMAADILIHNATIVPVGHDQLPHLEKTREFAEKFNNEFGKVFSLPQPHTTENLRILSLKGQGKMSKSHPEGALFMSDPEKTILQKIARAETAKEGEATPNLDSLLTIAAELGIGTEEFRKEHMAGKQVVGQFKKVLGETLVKFISNFQNKRSGISDREVLDVIMKGGAAARLSAEKTMERVKRAVRIDYLNN